MTPTRLRALVVVLLTCAGLLAPIISTQAAESRVALVIGNFRYTHTAPLVNPGHDAEAMANALRSAGFDLIGGGAMVNLDKPRMERAIREFGRHLGRDTVGLFYYAGHGVQINGAN
jgi:uncharacterized caspase-like protein